MELYTLVFNDKESVYSRNVIEKITYIQKLINSEMKETQERRINLPFPSYVFDYVIGRISTARLFKEHKGDEIMINLIRLADYTCDNYIKRVTVGLLDYEEEEVKKQLSSHSVVIGELPRFFIDENSRQCCHILRRSAEELNDYVSNISKHELLTMCRILQHSELSRLVILIAKWESVNNEDMWNNISKYHYSLRRDTFKLISDFNSLLLTKQLVINHLKYIPFIYDGNNEHRRCVYIGYPTHYEFMQVGDNNLTISVKEDCLVITSIENIQDVIVTIHSDEYECFYIGDMDKYTRFEYLNTVVLTQYYIYYTEEY